MDSFTFTVRIVNCIQKYFVTTSFENNLLIAKGQTEFCLQQFLDSNFYNFSGMNLFFEIAFVFHVGFAKKN